MDADEQSDPPKSPVGREFESKFFGGDWVIAAVGTEKDPLTFVAGLPHPICKQRS